MEEATSNIYIHHKYDVSVIVPHFSRFCKLFLISNLFFLLCLLYILTMNSVSTERSRFGANRNKNVGPWHGLQKEGYRIGIFRLTIKRITPIDDDKLTYEVDMSLGAKKE